MRECAQWSRDEAGKVGGREGVPAKLGSVLIANPKTPRGKRAVVPEKLGGVFLCHQPAIAPLRGKPGALVCRRGF